MRIALVMIVVCLSLIDGLAVTLVRVAQKSGLRSPAAALDLEGNCYIAERGANRILKLSPTGDSLAAVSGSGWAAGQFDEPSSITVRGIDVFVADHNNHRIQRFDRQLNPVASLFTRDNVREQERFGFPRGVATSGQGDMFLIDGENKRVLKVSPFTNVVMAFGGPEAGMEQLVDPTAIAVEANGLIDIVDNGSIKRFDMFGGGRGMIDAKSPQWCSAGATALVILSSNTLYQLEGLVPVLWGVIPGIIETVRGFAISGERVVVWTATDVVVFAIHE